MRSARHAHRIVEGLIITVIGSLLVALAIGQVHGLSLYLSPSAWVVCACVALLALGILLEVLVDRPNQSQAESPFAVVRSSYGELIRSMPVRLSTMIENAAEIQILGGTMIEFVRQEDALEALAVALSRGAKIEIIMLNPKADILRAIAAERAERSNKSAQAIRNRLKEECEFSLERLLATVPSDAAGQILRLSAVMPHHGFSRYDDSYLLTTYTFARGGSAPSALFRKTVKNAPLCTGLTRGFAELWTSGSVEPPDPTRPVTTMQPD